MRSITTAEGAEPLLRALPRDAPLWVVGETLTAARTLLRDDARQGPRTGAEAFTLDGLALWLARPALDEAGLLPVGPLGLPALVAELLAARGPSELGRYAESREAPGLVRALARALGELTDADLSSAHLGPHDPVLASLMVDLSQLARRRGLVLRAGIYERALARLAALDTIPAVLLAGPRLRTALEAELVASLSRHATWLVAMAPPWDRRMRAALGPDVELASVADGSLADAAARLFVPERGSPEPRIHRFAARTESEECAEIAGRIAAFLAGGARPDEIAVVLADPATYRAPLAFALGRAEVPHGTQAGARRPDPRGRALLALIDCALEGLSARAFAEYLSFAVLPPAEGGAPPASWPGSERLGEGEDAAGEDEDEDDDDGVVRAGTLRSPERLERVLVDAAVTLGGAARWRARLAGLRERIHRARREADDRATLDALAHEEAALAAFEGFALPLVEDLEALPGQHGTRSPLSEHVDRLGALATRALARPGRVLSVLAELRRRGEAADVTLSEVRALLDKPLRDVVAFRDRGATGVEILGLSEIFGRSFVHVLVPGMAERVFPRPVREDPVLGDELRQALGEALAAGEGAGDPDRAPRLPTRRERIEEERDLLRAIVSAARGSVTASHALIDGSRGRGRLPSLYLLELARLAEGHLPGLGAVAPEAPRGRLSAPAEPARAIDGIEHGLSTLDRLFAMDEAAARGHARHLFDAHPGLARAVRLRWAREQDDREYSADGLAVTDAAGKALLLKHLPSARAYSATALESFAACPYRFFLKAILRLSPVEKREPLLELDPLLFGSLTHTLQHRTLTRLRHEGVPFEAGSEERALLVLEAERAALEQALLDEHVLAVPGALRGDLERLGRDARRWLVTLLQSGWRPVATELAFGLSGAAADAERDEASLKDPVALASGLRLRGAIDLVEAKDGALRATDHKTGRARVVEGTRLGGGVTLQPALYAEALEALLKDEAFRVVATERAGSASLAVSGGRLFYCTTKGGFSSVEVPHDAETRAGLGVLVAALTAEIERGRLLRRPRPGDCTYCDHAAVCGPDEAARAAHKKVSEPLVRLRKVR